MEASFATRIAARVLLYVAVLATGGAFGIIFTGDIADGAKGAALPGGASAVMLGAALVAMVVGSSGRWRFVLLFPATALYALLAVYGRPPSTSLAAWRAFFVEVGNDLYAAAGTMYAEPVPYDTTPGLLVAMIPIVMIVAAFATSATLYEESPVISVAVLGLTIGVLSTISFEDGIGPFFVVFVVCAVGLLLVTGTAASLRPAAIVAAAVVVAIVLVTPRSPVADEAISSGAIDWTRIGTGGTSRLDVQADVGEYLTSGRDAELMRIQSPEPLLWRAGTLDYFDGVRWSDTTSVGENDGEEIAQGVETRVVSQQVEVLDARTDRVFGAYKVINTNLTDASPNVDGSWTVDEPLTKGSTYQVLSEVPQPTEEQLQGAGTGYPLEVQKFLQLPNNTPDVVAQTAQKIQADYDPQTPYDKARAIERYLIQDGGFTYNLNVDYRRADEAIQEFLGEGKEGFCTQFTTAMALIAREMNVPTRVVYGSTPGRKVGNDEYIVTGSNMHTWVEAYFPGVGWYPFDPTPGFSVPSAMEANAPRPDLADEPKPVASENRSLQQQQLDRRQQQEEQKKQQEEAAATGKGNGAQADEGLPVWPLLVLGGAFLVALPFVLKRLLLLRGRPEDLYRDLTGRLRDLLPPGRAALADSHALTPTERITLLAGAAGVGDETTQKLAAFARAYSVHLYSDRRGSGTRPAYRDAVSALKELPPWRRVLAALNPSSLFVRAAGGLAAARNAIRKRLRRRRERR